MNNLKKCLLVAIIACILVGCNNETNTTPSIENPQPSIEPQVQTHIFEAPDFNTIELTGQEILDGEEANMNVMLSDEIEAEFYIARDNPNGTKLYAIINSEGINFANNLDSSVFDDYGFAKPSYTYQIACYDFNNDGIEEVVIACGDKKKTLSIFVFSFDADQDIAFNMENYITGYSSAYVNNNEEICVASPSGDIFYNYSFKPEDAGFKQQIFIDYVTKEQLEQYNAIKYVISEGGNDILILPINPLENVTISAKPIGLAEENSEAIELYTIPTITPEKPLVLTLILPDLPSYSISYTDQTGTRHQYMIAEDPEDGALMLIEQ